jgi:predicted nuclease of restriction endonuclease-like RecB superfamily
VLTTDMVHTRRRGDRLLVVPVAPEERPRALDLAAAYLDLASAHVGQSRGTFLEACRGIDVQPSEQRLARGLLKLVLDRCDFEENSTLDAAELRRTLFARAARARTESQDAVFDRARILADEASERQSTAEELEAALFADLPDAHKMGRTTLPGPEALLAQHHLAQHQAVLLRAQSVTATVWNATPAATRDLFRKLKFLRLLYRIEPLPKRTGYRLEIDGPYSLFESVTKYGLQLALALPSLMACDRWAIEADVRWGKDRRPMRFGLKGSQEASVEALPSQLPDEVASLLADLANQPGPWRPAVSQAILDLPGVGQCVPDLEFVHQETGQTVYLEVLGFWSREAVWKRVELAQKGLPHLVLFAVSKHLRVSEAVLESDQSAALYVYARAMSASAVMARIHELAARPCA